LDPSTGKGRLVVAGYNPSQTVEESLSKSETLLPNNLIKLG